MLLSKILEWYAVLSITLDVANTQMIVNRRAEVSQMINSWISFSRRTRKGKTMRSGPTLVRFFMLYKGLVRCQYFE